MRLIIAGGGTGGHLFPGIAIAEEFNGRGAENEVLFVGTEKGIEARVLPKLGWPVRFISAEGIKGKGVLSKIRALYKLIPGFFESVKVIKEFRPDAVIGVGGYASAPLLMAARFLKIRTTIHEQNALPGVTNRILGKFVNRVFISFPDSAGFFPERKVVVSGNPLRREIVEGLQWPVVSGQWSEGKKPAILVFGGSLGAHRINMA
ncbi:MAG: glycosyltransferase, partial [Deltaproteobacteria bacterium]